VRHRTLWDCAWPGCGAAGVQQHGVRTVAAYMVEGGAGGPLSPAGPLRAFHPHGRWHRTIMAVSPCSGERGTSGSIARRPHRRPEVPRPAPREPKATLAERNPHQGHCPARSRCQPTRRSPHPRRSPPAEPIATSPREPIRPHPGASVRRTSRPRLRTRGSLVAADDRVSVNLRKCGGTGHGWGEARADR
jgi:hypothetical protein